MLIDILNVNDCIQRYGWKQVKVSNYFVPNTSENHPEGLVSNEIFGNPGTIDRKTKWGYIALNDYFMSPHIYYIFSRLKSSIANDMKQGLGNYYIDKRGEITKLPEGKSVPQDAIVKEIGTGFNWMRNNWDKIEWRVTQDMSKTAKDQRQLLQTLSVDEVFINNYPVMPAFYRDVDFKTQKRNIINSQFYSRMIHFADIIAKTDDFNIAEDDPTIPKESITHVKMQDLIMEIYLFFMKKCSGANGFINDYVVGKATDYGARLVISCPNQNVERYTDCECDFFHSSVPMSIAINIFAPYMIYGITSWIKNYVHGRNFIQWYNPKTHKIEEKELDPTYLDEFSVQNIKKMLNRYKKSKYYRIKPFTFKAADGTRIPIYYYLKSIDGKDDENLYIVSGELEGKVVVREMNYCELFTIVANKTIKDKYIFNTRYPVLDYNGTYPSSMNIIPANKTKSVYVNGEFIKRFPIISRSAGPQEAEHLFTDTMRMFSVYPSAMGADFDGDQISTQSVLSEEATQECYRHAREASNVVGLNGELMREFPHVVEQGLFGLTYKIPMNNIIEEDKKGGK